MANDINFKIMNGVHRVVTKLTFGLVGKQLLGMPVLELTTIGRKSGLERATMLTSPLQRGDAYFVVASRGGDDKPPAWLLNLEANADVKVSIKGGPTQPWKARVLPSAERAEVWPVLTKDHANYAGYQKKTEREIPVVELTPA